MLSIKTADLQKQFADILDFFRGGDAGLFASLLEYCLDFVFVSVLLLVSNRHTVKTVNFV